jgi:hypothetical protein
MKYQFFCQRWVTVLRKNLNRFLKSSLKTLVFQCFLHFLQKFRRLLADFLQRIYFWVLVMLCKKYYFYRVFWIGIQGQRSCDGCVGFAHDWKGIDCIYFCLILSIIFSKSVCGYYFSRKKGYRFVLKRIFAQKSCVFDHVFKVYSLIFLENHWQTTAEK